MALITGASRGIGKAVAMRFAEQGAHVAVNYIHGRAAAEKVCQSITAAGGQALAVGADVSETAQVQGIVEKVLQEFKQIDILVNNAAILKTSTLLDASMADLDRMIDVNLRGAIHCVRAVGRHMIDRKYGRILNIASIAAMGTPFAGTTGYSATKAALVALTKRLAFEFGPHHITVNAIAPGFIRTDMALRDGDLSVAQGNLELVAKRAMLGRLGEPEDIANAALFLASDEASFITAQTLTVDGGRMDFFSHSA